MSDRCAWCGVDVDPDEGFRASEPAGARRAAFCRLEHVVPWAMEGPHWEPDRTGADDEGTARGLGVCAQCGADLPDTPVLLVRHRGEHRIADAFCHVDHLLAWAKRGGRWRTGV